MRYNVTKTITGSSEASLKCIRDALIANGFIVVNTNLNEFSVSGPGMMSSQQNPIRGVSIATVRAQNTTIQIEAELAGAAFLGRFAMFFPLSLGVFLAVVFGFILWAQGRLEKKSVEVIVPLLCVSPWVVLGPLMAHSIRRRTEKAIDALLQNAAEVSRVG